MSVTKTVGAICAAIGICFIAWLIYRASTLGTGNVFSREHVFVEKRPLTERVAIEASRKALQASGYNVSELAPVEYAYDFPEGQDERIFARSTLNEQEGRVGWGPAPGGSIQNGASWTLSVTLAKEGDKIRCRVYRAK